MPQIQTDIVQIALAVINDPVESSPFCLPNMSSSKNSRLLGRRHHNNNILLLNISCHKLVLSTFESELEMTAEPVLGIFLQNAVHTVLFCLYQCESTSEISSTFAFTLQFTTDLFNST